jgi:hypothetical protein
MNTDTLIEIVSVVAFLAFLYFSKYSLRNHPKVTSEELEKLRPELGSIKFKYIAIQIIVVLVSSLISFIASKSDTRFNFLFLPVICSSVILYDGIFSLITGVHPVSKRVNVVQFVYDNNKSLQWIALSQIGLAIFEGVLCFVIFQSYNR